MTDLATRPAAGQFSAPAPRRTRRPSWLDFRLIAGTVLVLGAVLAGSAVMRSADHRAPVWQLTRDLASGTVLRQGDVRPVRVQLGSASRSYLSSADAVVGKSVRADVRAGELLSRADLSQPVTGVTVTVPVRAENAPAVTRGDRITVWVTTKTCRAVVVVSGVDVQEVKSSGSSAFGASSDVGVVLTLPSADAQRVITALDLDSAVLRVGVLGGGQSAAPAGDSLAACSAESR